MNSTAADTLANQILSGDRAALARGITLVESTRGDHQAEAQRLLQRLLPRTGNSVRIGITGVPGVGKSTLIEAFGLHLIEQGHKVAVLAIDPTSSRTGGSILGDKTRMQQLSVHEKAFIRPTPTGGELGGVSRRTREALLLCEAAGYDVVIVETVGVGQSETEVAEMVDLFMLLLLPGSGDELQGIKRGIVELADVLVVNKADGDLLAQARRVQGDYAAALRMLTPSSALWQPRVLSVSALEGRGIGEIWSTVQEFMETMRERGAFARKRAGQAKAWMWRELESRVMARFLESSGMDARIAECESAVERGEITPGEAVGRLLAGS